MSINNKYVPEIRFKVFEENWKPKKIGNKDVASFYSGGTPASSIKEFYDGEIPFIRSAEIHKSKTELYITTSGLENSSAKLVEKGCVLYALYGATSGEVDLCQIEGGAINQAILAIIPKTNYDANFLVQLLTREKSKILGKYLQGGQGNLSAEILKNIDFYFPKKDEQFHISSFFSELNIFISSTQQKLDKLRNIKKSSLNKMFPKNGAKIPEIRFEGFEGEWKEERLGSIGHIFTGLSGKTKEDFGHGDAEFITYMNIFSNPVANRRGTENVEIDKTQTCVQYGDIFFTTSSETPNEVGMSSVWLFDEKNIYLNSFCFGYRLFKNIDPYYIAYFLRSYSFRKNMIVLAQGISRYNITPKKVMDLFLLFPIEQEQKKIGEYFKHLDDLIMLTEQKLKKLKNIKSACLDKMFVKMED